MLFPAAPALCVPAPPCHDAIRPPAAVVGADPGAPYDLKDPPAPAGAASALEYLCWRVNKSSVTAPDGALLTRAQMKAFLSDFDSSLWSLTDEDRASFYSERCRFQDGGKVICLEENGKPHVLLNIEFAMRLRNRDIGVEKLLADKIAHYLASRPDPNAPLSALDVKSIEGLSYNTTGKRGLPPELSVGQALRSGLSPARLAGNAQDVSQALTEYFDQSRSEQALAHMNAFPTIHDGQYGSKTDWSYFDQSEQVLSQRIQAQVAQVLSGDPVGRELLARFHDNQGRLRLPGFMVGDLDSADYAATVFGRNVIVFNRKAIMNDPAFSSMSPAEKQAVAADSSKLTAWLLAHPQATADFVRSNDVSLAHELTHAALDREIPLGYYLPSILLENEHEAFTTQERYAMAELLAHPKAFLSDPTHENGVPSLASVLSNYNQFLQGIDRSYLEANSVGAASIPTVQQLVSSQESESRSLAERVADLAKKEWLKARGLQETQDQLRAFKSDYDVRTASFTATILPRMQAQAKERFPALSLQALQMGQGDTTEEGRFRHFAAALSLAKTASGLGAGGAAASRVQSAAANQARAELSSVAKTPEVAARYYRVAYGLAYAGLSDDAALKKEAYAAARAYVQERLASAAAEKRGAAQTEAQLALGIARQIGDKGLEAKADAALSAARGQRP